VSAQCGVVCSIYVSSSGGSGKTFVNSISDLFFIIMIKKYNMYVECFIFYFNN
jgi:hypothetical protein